MALDPSPVAKITAELMDELDEKCPDDAEFQDAIVIVEVAWHDEDGEVRTEVRQRTTTERATVVVGMVEIAGDSVRREDPDADPE